MNYFFYTRYCCAICHVHNEWQMVADRGTSSFKDVGRYVLMRFVELWYGICHRTTNLNSTRQKQSQLYLYNWYDSFVLTEYKKFVTSRGSYLKERSMTRWYSQRKKNIKAIISWWECSERFNTFFLFRSARGGICK